jgi:hypothetical protein
MNGAPSSPLAAKQASSALVNTMLCRARGTNKTSGGVVRTRVPGCSLETVLQPLHCSDCDIASQHGGSTQPHACSHLSPRDRVHECHGELTCEADITNTQCPASRLPGSDLKRLSCTSPAGSSRPKTIRKQFARQRKPLAEDGCSMLKHEDEIMCQAARQMVDELASEPVSFDQIPNSGFCRIPLRFISQACNNRFNGN